MSRADNAQLNIRSRFARERAGELARASGMSTTQVVEEALRAYVPPGVSPPPQGLIRKGRLLVLAANGETVTLEEAQAALDASRAERDDAVALAVPSRQ